MKKNVIRCVHGVQLRDIKNDTFAFDKVGVYYGFNNYNRTVNHIMQLVDVIREEVPGVEVNNLTVYEITTAQSDRHAHHTMVQVYVDAKLVKENLSKYMIL